MIKYAFIRLADYKIEVVLYLNLVTNYVIKLFHCLALLHNDFIKTNTSIYAVWNQTR